MNGLLTEKQKEFVRFLMAGESQKSAYVKAGFSMCKNYAANANKFANNPRILAEIKRLQGRADTIAIHKSGLSKAKVLDRLENLANSAETDKQYAAARGCWELLGREIGMFKTTQDVNVKSLSDYSLEDLKKLAQRLGDQGEAETVQ